MYAIVDIETTGGSAKKHSITEIAIVVFDGKEVVDRYETLINPQELIPRSITTLTGITNEMVENAPLFEEVAEEIFSRLEGKIFVAHNVGFDYSFVRNHLIDAGYKWNSKRLCTVRLSRKIIPGLYSYSLGKIAQQLGYKIDHRHRAMGDCAFTADLFALLLEKDTDGHVAFALNQRSREASMPPNLPVGIFERIPKTLGVYLFNDAKGSVIYVGKANNLKHRVSEHFRGSTHTGYKSHFAEKIIDVKWIECPTELIALLTEAREIKKHWPPYNRVMKRVTLNWGIFSYYDQNGYGRYSIGRVGKWAKPVVTFRNQFEARQELMLVQKNYTLCARYCDLQEAAGECAEDVHGECFKACVLEESSEDYNARYTKAKDKMGEAGGTVVIQESGFDEHDQSLVLVENGRYKGHGLAPKSLEINSINDIIDYLDTGYDDQDMQAIIQSQINKASSENLTVLAL